MKKQKKAITWRELKDFANSLSEENLNDDVIWWGDERGGRIQATTKLEERYYRDDIYYNPESCFERIDEEHIEDLDDYMEKGTPILHTDEYEEEPETTNTVFNS